MMPRTLLVAGTLLAGVALAGTLTARRLAADEASRRAALEVRHDAEMRDADLAFFRHRAELDPSGASDLAMAAGLLMQRSRETGANADIESADALARRSLANRARHNLRARQVLAGSLVAQHRFAEALVQADTLVAEAPDVPSLRAMRAEVLLELGRYDEAKAAFGMLQSYGADPAIAPGLAHWRELTGDVAGASRLLEAAWAAIAPRATVPREQRAWFAMRLGDLALRHGALARADHWYALAIATAPGDYRVEAALARLAAARADWDGVFAHGGRALETAVEPGTLGLMADAARASGDTASAASFEAGMLAAATAQAGPLHRQWSLHLLDHGLAVALVRERAEAELAHRRDIYGWDVVAWARFKGGDLPGATLAARQALVLGTPDALLLYHAGAIARAAGDTATARRDLQRALEVNATFDRAQADDARRMLRELGA